MSLLKKIFLLILLILTSFTAPQATAQQENDDGGDLLIITVPIIAAGAMRRYQACLDEMQPECENTYLYRSFGDERQKKLHIAVLRAFTLIRAVRPHRRPPGD